MDRSLLIEYLAVSEVSLVPSRYIEPLNIHTTSYSSIEDACGSHVKVTVMLTMTVWSCGGILIAGEAPVGMNQHVTYSRNYWQRLLIGRLVVYQRNHQIKICWLLAVLRKSVGKRPCSTATQHEYVYYRTKLPCCSVWSGPYTATIKCYHPWVNCYDFDPEHHFSFFSFTFSNSIVGPSPTTKPITVLSQSIFLVIIVSAIVGVVIVVILPILVIVIVVMVIVWVSHDCTPISFITISLCSKRTKRAAQQYDIASNLPLITVSYNTLLKHTCITPYIVDENKSVCDEFDVSMRAMQK